MNIFHFKNIYNSTIGVIRNKAETDTYIVVRFFYTHGYNMAPYLSKLT